jgi:hypothetical protein
MTSGWNDKGWYVIQTDCTTMQCKAFGHYPIEAVREPNQECKRTAKDRKAYANDPKRRYIPYKAHQIAAIQHCTHAAKPMAWQRAH